MYIYISIPKHTRTHAQNTHTPHFCHSNALIHTHIYIHIHIYVYIYIYTYIRIYICIYVHIYIYKYTSVYIHIYIHISLTHINTHTHTHTHTHSKTLTVFTWWCAGVLEKHIDKHTVSHTASCAAAAARVCVKASQWPNTSPHRPPLCPPPSRPRRSCTLPHRHPVSAPYTHASPRSSRQRVCPTARRQHRGLILRIHPMSCSLIFIYTVYVSFIGLRLTKNKTRERVSNPYQPHPAQDQWSIRRLPSSPN